MSYQKRFAHYDHPPRPRVTAPFIFRHPVLSLVGHALIGLCCGAVAASVVLVLLAIWGWL